MNYRKSFFRYDYKLIFLYLFLSSLFFEHTVYSQTRKEINFPDIPGYITLITDLHNHTLFSDGKVWPSIRIREGWIGGLDAMAITDHIDSVYWRRTEDINHKRDRAYEIALPEAESLNIILIKGGEISKKTPPGHFCAIFLKDIEPLNKEQVEDAIKAAKEQGAFITWNHPGRDQAGLSVKPSPINAELLNKGLIDGIEVVNYTEYYPDAHRLALEKGLTMLGNSDVHDPIDFEFVPSLGEHRPCTLIFAKEKSLDSIKEALFAHRTAVYYKNMLIGEKQYLEPIFNASVVILNPSLTVSGRRVSPLQISNSSAIDYELELIKGSEEIEFPEKLTLNRDCISLVTMNSLVDFTGNKATSLANNLSGLIEKEITVSYKVKNMLIAPDDGLTVVFTLKIIR